MSPWQYATLAYFVYTALTKKEDRSNVIQGPWGKGNDNRKDS